jgi:hypothetical protein
MRTSKKISPNYLEFVPVHNPAFKSVTDENGNVTILQENKGLFYFLTQKILGKPRISQIHLDEMGNFIWPLMDGSRSILQIAELVREEFGEKAQPLYDRLVTYIETLKKYGFIILEMLNNEP